jgi:adenylosuccinate synthase
MSARPALRAIAVVDLGFGDAGKGLITDYLARRTTADVVVRFNGGAQAGHNVVTPDGRHHTFSQLGAASCVPGVRTFLSRHVVVHPTALLSEIKAIAQRGVGDALERVAISEHALVVTPFHQAANMLRELARGDRRHGSCGVGVGEAVRAAELHPEDAIRAADFRAPEMLERKTARLCERLHAELSAIAMPADVAANRELWIFEDRRVFKAWREMTRPVVDRIVPDETLAEWLSRSRAAIFEGAQGLLLDGVLGFHPHTTWSDCTATNARTLLAEAAPGVKLDVWGVLRAHAIRHGPGPFPSEHASLGAIVRDHNATNRWQGAVRYGWFDAVLARYALSLTSQLDVLALTHVDALARRASWSMCDAYRCSTSGDEDLVARNSDGHVNEIEARAAPTLERQERLGLLLARCAPVLERVPSDEVPYIDRLETRLDRRIDVVSRGPTCRDVETRTETLA